MSTPIEIRLPDIGDFTGVPVIEVHVAPGDEVAVDDPIVNAPEVAILGVVRARTSPVWDGEAFVPRLMLPVSLSYDHRVIDGALAARFTRQLCTVLEDVRRLLL